MPHASAPDPIVAARAPGGAAAGLGGTSFVEAARAAVSYLAGQAPLDLWLVARVDGTGQAVVASVGRWSTDGAPVGEVLPWLGSFGVHMAAGTAPPCAPDVTRVPGYAAAATGRWSGVRGYTGVPLLRGADELWGTLSGYTGLTDDARLVEASAAVCLLGGLLSSLLVAEAARSTADDRAGALDAELRAARYLADTDVLTGLRNRRGWVDALGMEDRRASRSPATPSAASGVIALDLDDLKGVNDRLGHHAGDSLLRRTARVLTTTCRGSDVVARPGGDEFTVLAVDLTPAGVQALTARLDAELAADGIAASVGCAVRRAGEDLDTTWARADASMYGVKQRRAGLAQPGR